MTPLSKAELFELKRWAQISAMIHVPDLVLRCVHMATEALDQDRVLLEAYRRVVAVTRMANDRSPDIRVGNALRSLDEIQKEVLK